MDTLADAAAAGDLAAVTRILSGRPDEINKTESGDLAHLAPIHRAIKGGHIDVLRFLIAQGADIHIVDKKDGRSPLVHYALRYGQHDAADLLLENGVEGSPGDYAALGMTEEVKALIEMGLGLESKGRNGYTILHQAAMNGQESMVQLLLDAGADVHAEDRAGNSPLSLTVRSGRREGFADVARLLIRNGARVNAVNGSGRSVLEMAAFVGAKEIAGLLLENGAEGNIHIFASLGMTEEVDELIKMGTDVEARSKLGRTPLHRAAMSGQKETAELLIRHHGDVNAKDFSGGKTPLSFACSTKKRSNVAMIRYLISQGADVNAVNKRGDTPLFAALFAATHANHLDYMEILLQHGADPNATDGRGTPLLHRIAFNGSAELADVVLRNGASINMTDKDGQTPLHHVGNSHVASVGTAQVILRYGADVNATDKDGLTPLDLAMTRRRIEMAVLFLKHGGK